MKVNGSDIENVDGVGIITASTTVSADVVDTTETALFTHSLKAGELQLNQTYRILLYGRWTRSGVGGPTLTLRVRLGGISGTVLIATAAIATTSASTNALWGYEALMTVRSVGATGTVWITGYGVDAGVSSGAIGLRMLNAGASATAANAATITVDTTADQDLVASAQFSANTAGNSVSIDEALILKAI